MDEDPGNVLAAKGADLGGGGASGDCSPSVADRLADEEIEKDRLGRKMALVFASVMGILCISCIVFALWTGLHFLNRLDEVAYRDDVVKQVQAAVKEVVLTHASQDGGELKLTAGASAVAAPSAVDGDRPSR